MNDYNFSQLNDKEFENLSIELISKDRKKRYERFKEGKDGGIDGRYYHDDGSQEIIQCKHYLKTGYRGLISSLKKKNDKEINEIEKVKRLNPSKYIFATSLPLSAKNKEEIKELFSPYIKKDNDIYGQEDLNSILANNPEIEKRYCKLWLSSTVVLDRLVNKKNGSKWELSNEGFKNIIEERYKNSFEDAYNRICNNNLLLKKMAKTPSEVISEIIDESGEDKEVVLGEFVKISSKSLFFTQTFHTDIKKYFHKSLAYLWSKGEIYKEFEYLIYLSLSQWKEGGLKSLIRDSYYSLDEELISLNIKENNKTIIFLFDDIDRLDTKRREDLIKEINNHNLLYYTFISSATSRQRSSLDIFDFDESFDLRFRISNDVLVKKDNISLKEKAFNYFQNYYNSINIEYEIDIDKKLYAKDIEDQITFEIIIKLYIPYKTVTIVKCFDTYEDFSLNDMQNIYHQKSEVNAQQIIIVSSNIFEENIIQYAKNKSAIGLLGFDEISGFEWILRRYSFVSREHNTLEQKSIRQTFQYKINYALSNGISTNSFPQFMINLLSNNTNKKHILNLFSSLKNNYEKVKFLSDSNIQQSVSNLLNKIDYEDGLVDLNKIIAILKKESNLSVHYNQALNKDVLGEIDFQKSLILIDNYQCETFARTRFTVAHEIGHYCLDHARYMYGEKYTKKLEENMGKKLDIHIEDIAKMELQANQFASFLLLPTNSFLKDVNILLKEHDIKDKGFGLLYVDGQKCNQDMFYKIASPLMQKYKVSKMVIEIRLKKLGILYQPNTYKLAKNTYQRIENIQNKVEVFSINN